MEAIGALITVFIAGVCVGVICLGLFQMIHKKDVDINFFLEDQSREDVDQYYDQFNPPSRR